jgi:hypothetical protein
VRALVLNMKSMTTPRKIFLAVLTVLVLTLNVSVAFAQSSSQDIGSILSSIFSNPSSIVIFIIEFALGLGLGYFSAKAIKYILAIIGIFIVGLVFLAIIGIFIVGVVLNVWAAPNLGAFIQQQLSSLGLDWSKLYPVIMSIIYVIGLTTVLWITLGFIIGIVG